VLFDGEEYDPDELHSLVGNTDRITIIVPGVYTLSAWGVWDVNDTGTERLRITVNNVAVAGQSVNTSVQTIALDISVSREHLMAAGDIVRLEAYQTSGGDLNLDTATLGVTRIS